ncbi:MAG: SDR family NAD(P)-dependent oxidoreductase, partial [Sphingomonadaceae bacterium]|nr:SDR family NAD(P)-dependent oxidoreductase [Sphingomonadaceae bacterium]
MARVAIVTGGTRGIGEAICQRLKKQGHTVIANYAGNEEKAKAFSDATGIAAYKWDVGDHEACIEGCAKVEADHGPIDIVINNAGITRDGT